MGGSMPMNRGCSGIPKTRLGKSSRRSLVRLFDIRMNDANTRNVKYLLRRGLNDFTAVTPASEFLGNADRNHSFVTANVVSRLANRCSFIVNCDIKQTMGSFQFGLEPFNMPLPRN